jgi:hypothetical protein
MRYLLTILLLSLAEVSAQTTSATPTGYVVRIESSSVYLDLGANSGASPGQDFQIYKEGEELKHPVTNQPLGRLNDTLAGGTLREVLPLYSIGTLSSPTAGIKPGMRAKLLLKSPSPAPAQTLSPWGPAKPPSPDIQTRWRSPLFDFKIVGMAVGDFLGNSQHQIALTDEKTIRLYPYPPQDNKPLAEFTHPGIMPRIVSLDTADLNSNGRSEIFASLYNGSFERLETVILEMEEGKLRRISDIPWLVRTIQDPEGRGVLACQQIIDDSSFPFTGVYPLTYKGGRYGPSSRALPHKGADSIFDFTQANLDGQTPGLLYLSANSRLSVRSALGFWKSREAYSQTPTRLRWHEKLIEFRPSLAVSYDDQNRSHLYILRNLSRFGFVTDRFGTFTSAELHRKYWNGLALETEWKTELGGYAPALAMLGDPHRPQEIIVAVVGSTGKSSLWVFDP